MKHILNLFICVSIIIGCNNQSKNTNEIKTHLLSDKLKENYNLLSKRKDVTGFLHYKVCDEKSAESLQYLRDSSSKSELLWMLSDTCEKGFKLFLIEEIHRKYSELDSMLISKYGNDTSTITFNTSCMGILYQKEFGEVCRNIVDLNAFDTLSPIVYSEE